MWLKEYTKYMKDVQRTMFRGMKIRTVVVKSGYTENL